MTIAQALRNIRETPPRLEDAIVTQVWGSEGYDEQHLDPVELASRVQGNVAWLLDAIVDPEPDPRLIADFETVRIAADDIGVRRAIQGVGIDAVIGSWRTAERTIQERLMGLAGDVDTDELLVALRRLSVLVGILTDCSVEGYRRIQQEVTAHYDQLATDLVARIVSRSGLTAGEVEERARVVQADPRAEYAAVAFSVMDAPASAAAQTQAQRHLLGHLGPRAAGRILVGAFDDRPLLLVPLRRGGLDTLVAQLEEAARRVASETPLLIGLSSATSRLAESHGPARQARLALEVSGRLARPSGVTRYADVAVEALLLGDRETASLLVDRLGSVRQRPELVATLRAWLDTGRSARAAARVLYVHPNTVPHRLATISRLLGRDLGGEQDLLDLELAVRAHQLLASSAHP